jgi:phage-related protein
MKTVGAGVQWDPSAGRERAYRVIYLATHPEAVYVLHCFQKKTLKTSQHNIDLDQDALQGHTDT